MYEEYYGQFISEDSVIHLTNGVEMKGKYEVTKGILECCETYHKEHLDKLIKYGLMSTTLFVVAGLGIYKIIKHKKDKQPK